MRSNPLEGGYLIALAPDAESPGPGDGGECELDFSLDMNTGVVCGAAVMLDERRPPPAPSR